MLNEVKLKNYRNIAELNANLAPHVSLLVAPNGSGKSNFLESIYLTTLGSSFRPVASLSQVIGSEHDFTRVELSSDDDFIEMVISETKRLQRNYKLNDKRTAVKKIVGKIPLVVFAPHDVNLATGDPASRRKDLNDFLSLLYPEYQEAVIRYRKLLRNRNALLKNLRDHGGDDSQLSYWTSELLKETSTIVKTRLNFFAEIKPYVAASAADLYHYDSYEVGIKYDSKHGTTASAYLSHIRSKFQDRKDTEISAGQTLYGPHKDDYILLANNEDLKYVGSRGQQRLAIFVWKLAQTMYLSERRSQQPTLLIDDLMSELDREHQQQVAKFITSTPQIQYIITSAVAEDIPQDLKEKSKVLTIE